MRGADEDGVPIDDRVIRKEVVVNARLEDAWDAWTTSGGAKSFWAPDAKVELRIGGPFEIYFLKDAPKGSQGSEECKVLSYLPMEMLSFSWNAPPEMPKVRNKHTWVVIQFRSIDQTHVKVKLTHLGWKPGPGWDEAYNFFDKAWGNVLRLMAERLPQKLESRHGLGSA